MQARAQLLAEKASPDIRRSSVVARRRPQPAPGALRPSELPVRSAAAEVSIPTVGELGASVDQPVDGGAGPVAPLPAPAGLPCSAPLAIRKVTSGTLEGGLTMDSYYPDLVGRGYWAHGGTAGPFDTGSRAGSNVQIVATVGAGCPAAGFQLAQSVTYTRRTWNGVKDPLEGRTFDDIAKSGRDASRAPFRQDWAGPAAFVSMADPPSIEYSAYHDAEVDRAFTTSLIGSTGRVDVSWSTSIRVTGGRLTTNTVT